MYPISTRTATCTSSTRLPRPIRLVPDDANSAWLTILGEIDALRVAERE